MEYINERLKELFESVKDDTNEQERLCRQLEKFLKSRQQSIFNQRTDPASAEQYFQFYSYLSQQQNMMQDYVRTSTYQRAILSNCDDFKDKVVLDVGAGSGILSFFALQAGARKVYAVEASSMAEHAQLLVQSNNKVGKIEVLAGKIEEIVLPELVDTIISEPMGYMLYNERMLETYLHAKKWLRRPDKGRMFPSRGDLHVAPFSDAQLYMEQSSKANFWHSNDFHGVDLRALHSAAMNEYFRQPIVDTFDIRICMAKSVCHTVDFQRAHETDLHCINIPLEFVSGQTGQIHGLAFWFDVAFIGTNQTVWLSTAPTQQLTHWYQIRCLLTTPLFVHRGHKIIGHCVLRSNKRQSYDVDIELQIKELGTRASNSLDLKNPYFRYTGQPAAPPPGTSEISPSEQYWMTYDATMGGTVQTQATIVPNMMASVMTPQIVSTIGTGQPQTMMMTTAPNTNNTNSNNSTAAANSHMNSLNIMTSANNHQNQNSMNNNNNSSVHHNTSNNNSDNICTTTGQSIPSHQIVQQQQHQHHHHLQQQIPQLTPSSQSQSQPQQHQQQQINADPMRWN